MARDQRVDRRHDVGTIVLAMFGAVALTGVLVSDVGLDRVQNAIGIGWALLGVTLITRSVVVDASRGEVTFAAAITSAIANGMSWVPDRVWVAPDEGALVVSAALLVVIWGAAGCRYAPRSAHHVAFAGLIAAGIIGVLLLFALTIVRTGSAPDLSVLTWLAPLLAGATVAWRLPAITPKQLFLGMWFTFTVALALLIAASYWPSESMFLAPVLAPLFAGVGLLAHGFVARRITRRGGLPSARLR